MEGMDSKYVPPLALTIISSISIGVAGLVALWIAYDIAIRRGWRTMMAIMIPVYIINALYLWPITLWTYLKFGRPPKPGSEAAMGDGHDHGHASHNGDVEKADGAAAAGHADSSEKDSADRAHQSADEHAAHEARHADMPDMHAGHDMPGMHEGHHDMTGMHDTSTTPAGHGAAHHAHDHMSNPAAAGTTTDDSAAPPAKKKAKAAAPVNVHAMHATMHGGSAAIPMFATVTIAVCHCGAGCVLGDVIGEWIVFGTGAEINGGELWVEYLVDFAWALFLGIFFQYFSIAPMTGDYGWRSLWRATEADFLSLAAFEIGLFGWMAIFQIAIWNYRLEMDNVVYWWMMQIGMFFGHWTAFPINWWLITANVKERTH